MKKFLFLFLLIFILNSTDTFAAHKNKESKANKVSWEQTKNIGYIGMGSVYLAVSGLSGYGAVDIWRNDKGGFISIGPLLIVPLALISIATGIPGTYWLTKGVRESGLIKKLTSSFAKKKTL